MNNIKSQWTSVQVMGAIFLDGVNPQGSSLPHPALQTQLSVSCLLSLPAPVFYSVHFHTIGAVGLNSPVNILPLCWW